MSDERRERERSDAAGQIMALCGTYAECHGEAQPGSVARAVGRERWSEMRFDVIKALRERDERAYRRGVLAAHDAAARAQAVLLDGDCD